MDVRFSYGSSPGLAPSSPIRLGFSIAIASLALFGSACKQRIDDSKIVWVNPEQAQAAMTQRQGAFGLGREPDGVYLDPRPAAAFERGHIPGAINIPLSELDTRYMSLRDRTVVIVYDAEFDDELTKATTKDLMSRGLPDVRALRGGLRAWEREGNRIERSTGPDAGDSPKSP